MYQTSLSWFEGPAPQHRDGTSKVLGALTTSILFVLAYTPILGWLGPAALARVHHAQLDFDGWMLQITLPAALMLFVLPTTAALLRYRLRSWQWLSKHRPLYDPTPSAWDFAFQHAGAQPQFVRIRLTSGEYVGGLFNENSFASGFPDPHDIFIAQAYMLNEDGSFGTATQGCLWVAAEQIAMLEIVQSSDEEEATADEQHSAQQN